MNVTWKGRDGTTRSGQIIAFVTLRNDVYAVVRDGTKLAKVPLDRLTVPA